MNKCLRTETIESKPNYDNMCQRHFRYGKWNFEKKKNFSIYTIGPPTYKPTFIFGLSKRNKIKYYEIRRRTNKTIMASLAYKQLEMAMDRPFSLQKWPPLGDKGYLIIGIAYNLAELAIGRP